MPTSEATVSAKIICVDLNCKKCHGHGKIQTECHISHCTMGQCWSCNGTGLDPVPAFTAMLQIAFESAQENFFLREPVNNLHARLVQYINGDESLSTLLASVHGVRIACKRAGVPALAKEIIAPVKLFL